MKILYLAPIPYDGLRQRPQYIADGLAQKHEVIYVNPTVSWLKYLLKGGDHAWGYSEVQPSGVKVIQLNGAIALPRFAEGLWSEFGFLERLAIKNLLCSVDVAWLGFEPWYDLLRHFKGEIVYDLMDDNTKLSTNPLMRHLIVRTRTALEKRADFLFVTAQKLYDDAVRKRLTPVLVPNAVDIEQPNSEIIPAMKHKAGMRVFGYVGMIAHWFDMQAIQVILDAAPENHVILVGPEEIPRINDSRIHYVGAVPKQDVGAWIDSFDVCLYPFKQSELLDTINPVKIYEYMAQNKPVIAVKSLETKKFADRIALYENDEQLRILARSELNSPFRSEQDRQGFIAENSWQQRVNTILNVLE